MDKVNFRIQRFANVIHGTSGGDYGSNIADNTQVYGLAGNDTIETNGSKNVLLIGGSGNDVIHMTGGTGTLNGGAGADTFNLTYSGANTISAVIEDINPTDDKLIINYAGSEAPQINYSTVGEDVVLTDGAGYLNVTLKGYREANDYFDGTASENVWEVFKIVNQERENQGLNQLILSQGLIDGASIRAVEIEDTWGHNRPDGTSCFTAVEKSYNSWGENIAAGYGSPEAVMVGWMNSTGHRANILRDYFTKMGVGYFYKSSSYYGDYWVQLFGGALNETETVSIAQILSTAVTLSANGVTKSTSTLGNIASLKRTTVSGTSGADLLVNGWWYGEKGTQNIVINGGAGNDTISNSGANSVLNGGVGDDLIYNGYYFYEPWGRDGFLEESYDNANDDSDGSSKVTVSGGTGNDEIHSRGNGANVFLYNSGDGFDTIYGYSSSDTISITGGTYTKSTVGSNVILQVDSGAMTLVGAGGKTLNVVGTLEGGGTGTSKVINGTSGSDNLTNTVAGATINALGGNDLISNTSSASAAVIYGGAGNDNIFNYADSVTIDSGAGDNSIWNSGNKVKIYDGNGSDYINNSGDWTTIDFGDGDDYIYNTGYGVNMYSGTGDDYVGNSGDSTSICTGNGNDNVANSGDSVEISLGSGNDSVWNTGDSVTIWGGAGNDSINNLGKDVTINAGSGDDTVILDRSNAQVLIYNSGDGLDLIKGVTSYATISVTGGTYTKSTVGDDVIISVGSGSMRLIQASGTTLNIKGTLEGGGSSSNVINLTSGDDEFENYDDGYIINGLSGDDFIDNDGDNVTINGGTGKDLILNGGENVIINGDSGNDYIVNSAYSGTQLGGNRVTVNGGAGNDTLKNAASVAAIIGGDGSDSIYSSGNYVTIYGDSGNDNIQLYDNYITVSGGADNDTIYADGSYQLLQYASGDGKDIVYGFDEGDTLHVTSGSISSASVSGSDVVFKIGSGTVTLKNAKDKSLTLKIGSGSAFSTVISGSEVSTIPAGISVSGATLTASTAFTGNKISLADYTSTVTKVNASALSRGISIVGTAVANSLKGGKGADIIDGGAGNDTLYGGVGNDILYGGAGADKIYGEAGNDTLYGGAGKNTLTGGAGSDVFVYESGNDIITDYVAGTDKIRLASASITSASVSGSNVVLKTSSGNITVKGGKNKAITVIDKNGNETTNVYPMSTLPAGITISGAVLTAGTAFTGSSINLADYASTVTKVNASALSRGISIVGTAAANSLKGGKGADTISGGAGNDTVSLGGGNDIYVYSSGNDLIQDYKVGEDKIKLSGTSITSVSVSGSNVILKTSSGNITVKGGKDKNITVIDSRGAETTKIYPEMSSDTLPTGLSYDSAKKKLTVGTNYSGAAIDLANYATTTKTVDASAFTKKIQITGNNLGNTIKGGTGADTLIGGSKADTIYGGGANDKIYGETGADKLFGDDGNDTITGGAGNDTLTGGDGKDVFVYGSGDGKDVITDYTAGKDKIKLSSGEITSTSYSGSDVVFSVGSGSITVKNGNGQKITIVDAAGKTSTKTYSSVVSGRSALWFADDDNFITSAPALDSILQVKSIGDSTEYAPTTMDFSTQPRDSLSSVSYAQHETTR